MRCMYYGDNISPLTFTCMTESNNRNLEIGVLCLEIPILLKSAEVISLLFLCCPVAVAAYIFISTFILGWEASLVWGIFDRVQR